MRSSQDAGGTDIMNLSLRSILGRLPPFGGWSVAAAPTDRTYWEKRGTKATVQLVDELLVIVREIDPSLELKYNKFYIGLSKSGQAFNFVLFRPRKSTVNIELKLPRSDEIGAKIEKAGIES